MKKRKSSRSECVFETNRISTANEIKSIVVSFKYNTAYCSNYINFANSAKAHIYLLVPLELAH